MTALLSVIALTASLFTPASGPSAPLFVSSAPAPVEQAKPIGGLTTKATCTALCGASPSVTCTGTTCTGTNQSCPGQRGFVSCTTSGVTTVTNCPVCAPECTEGQFKTVITGPNCSCPDGMTTPKDRYKCINGVWEYQFSLCGAPFCQGF